MDQQNPNSTRIGKGRGGAIAMTLLIVEVKVPYAERLLIAA